MLRNFLNAGTLVCKLQAVPWTGGNGWSCRTGAVNCTNCLPNKGHGDLWHSPAGRWLVSQRLCRTQ